MFENLIDRHLKLAAGDIGKLREHEHIGTGFFVFRRIADGESTGHLVDGLASFVLSENIYHITTDLRGVDLRLVSSGRGLEKIELLDAHVGHDHPGLDLRVGDHVTVAVDCVDRNMRFAGLGVNVRHEIALHGAANKPSRGFGP